MLPWSPPTRQSSASRKEREAVFNDDQRDHMRELSERPPETLCWCGWATKGECPNCPPELSCADKMAVWCPECHNAPPATDRSKPITHQRGCKRARAG